MVNPSNDSEKDKDMVQQLLGRHCKSNYIQLYFLIITISGVFEKNKGWNEERVHFCQIFYLYLIMKELSLQLKENADLPLIQILCKSFRFFS